MDDVPPAGAAAPRTAVVTGAGRGLGAALATALAGRGLALGLCGRTAPPAPPGADAVCRAVDVADGRALGRFAGEVVARFGRIDVWVNNAAVLEPVGPLAEADLDAVARLVAVDLTGVLAGSAVFAAHVRTRPGGGVLVNVSSGAAGTPYEGWAPYGAAKAGVEQATEIVGREERAAGLRAFAVAPGVVDTAMQDRVRAASDRTFPAVGRFRRLHAEGRLSPPSWVADWILEHCVLPAGRLRPEGDAGAVHVRVPEPPSPGAGPA